MADQDVVISGIALIVGLPLRKKRKVKELSITMASNVKLLTIGNFRPMDNKLPV